MGADWRRSRRAHRIVLWVARALSWPGDRRDRGRIYWRERNHEGRPCGLGHICGWSGRRHRETFYRAHHDRDLSDERAIAAVAAAVTGGQIRILPLKTATATT